jgi:ssDNA-binding Zn-finger/Zn-ribbon topoisomerase 1
MNPQTIIRQIEFVLQIKTSEKYLYELLSKNLGSLDKILKNKKIYLSYKEKNLIKKFLVVYRKIKESIDLKEKLAEVTDLDQYIYFRKKLKALKDYLNEYAISQQIDKNIREFDSKLPSILKKMSDSWSQELNTKILQLEKDAPKCILNHAMVIRESKERGFFWGCSRFPDCFFTKKLSNNEKSYLAHQDEDFLDHKTIIRKFEYELNNTISEDSLYKILSEKLKDLESSPEYTYNSLSFDDKKTIEKYNEYLKYLETFIDLKDEINNIADFMHYKEVKNDLERLAEIFNGCAVSKRIDKELRELNEKIPDINQKERLIKDSKLNSKIHQLEKRCPKCPRKHNMVIRQGGVDGWFWGCSRFPDCFFTKKLSNKEWDYLFSDKKIKMEAKIDSDNIIAAEVETDDSIDESDLFNYKLSSSEMPQEKLVKYGVVALNNAELLALIIRTGTQAENVFKLCNRILECYNLSELSETSLDDLKEISGIGEVKACRILAVFELYNRLKKEKINFKSEIELKVNKNRIEKTQDENIRLNEKEKQIYHALKDWKNQTIEERRLVSYAIAKDHSLKIAAKIQPQSKEELLKIKGFSKSAVDFFVNDILAIINQKRTFSTVTKSYVQIPLTKKELAIYEELRKWRNDTAKELNLPSYMVIQNNPLKLLAKYLPRTKNELLKIKGFGQINVEKYGKSILDILKKF